MIFYFIYEILLKKYNIKFPSQCINKISSLPNIKKDVTLNEIVTIDTNNIYLYSRKDKNIKLKTFKKNTLDSIEESEESEELLNNENELIV